MSKPIAVLISDIHFTPATLELATVALEQALNKAYQLRIPLIVAGDTLDTKAVMRGECVNRLLEILGKQSMVQTYVMIGNHDLLNEKSSEHTLNFLKPYVTLVDSIDRTRDEIGCRSEDGLWLVAYKGDSEDLKELIKDIPKGSTIIMHQGVLGANMGHYIQDKTSLPPETFKDFRVISGHYHKAQDIKCGPPRKGAVGLFSYIGSPYTISFGEAGDGPKGFQILNDDGLLTHVPTNLRAHRIIELTSTKVLSGIIWPHPDSKDLIWVKVKGPKSELSGITRRLIETNFVGKPDFKLDLIADSSQSLSEEPTKSMTHEEALDAFVTASIQSPKHQEYLRNLWRKIVQ